MLNEKEVWQLATDNTIGGDLHADRFARAIEQAVIERLAQGVSVERLKNIDWQQFAMHGGEPCFDLDRDGSLCGRARHWFGHNAPGSFVSLHDFATTAIAAARVQALEEAAKVCDRQAIEQAVIAKLAGVSVEPLFWVYEAGTPGGYFYFIEVDRTRKDGNYRDKKCWKESPVFTELQLAAARVQALEEAAKVCDRQAIPNAGFLAEKVRALINTNLTTGEMK